VTYTVVGHQLFLSLVIVSFPFAELSSETITRVCIGDYEGNGLEFKDGDKLEVLDDTADGEHVLHA